MPRNRNYSVQCKQFRENYAIAKMFPDKSGKKHVYQEILTKVDRHGPNASLSGGIRLELLFLNSHQATHIFIIRKEIYQ